jgi:hypothetical protein
MSSYFDNEFETVMRLLNPEEKEYLNEEDA